MTEDEARKVLECIAEYMDARNAKPLASPEWNEQRMVDAAARFAGLLGSDRSAV